MPSPFPGMDPYLEAHDIWPDFHERLATVISSELNSLLPHPYYARLEMRPEVGIVEEGGRLGHIMPDIAVGSHQAGKGPAGSVAVLEERRTEISPSLAVVVSSEPLRHHFVEIRDPARGHHLITLIEIASPANKKSGVDREVYLRKQREILDSDANLVELDLLRSGEHLVPNLFLRDVLARLAPAPDYLVLVNRAWQRVGGDLGVQVFPVQIIDMLPVVPVPLKEKDPEVPLDLQYVFNQVYDGGPYRRGAIDYTQTPVPPLPEERRPWAEQLLRQHPGVVK